MAVKGLTKRFTLPIGFTVLGTILRTAGYTGGTIPSFLEIYNTHATQIVYVHITSQNDAAAAGLTGIDGIPVATPAASGARPFYRLERQGSPGSPDVNNIYLYAPVATDVIVAIQGS